MNQAELRNIGGSTDRGIVFSTGEDGYYFPHTGNGKPFVRDGEELKLKLYFGPFESREEAQTFSAFHRNCAPLTAPAEQWTATEIDAVRNDPGDSAYTFFDPCQCDYADGLTYVDVKSYWDGKQAEATRQELAGYPEIPAI